MSASLLRCAQITIELHAKDPSASGLDDSTQSAHGILRAEMMAAGSSRNLSSTGTTACDSVRAIRGDDDLPALLPVVLANEEDVSCACERTKATLARAKRIPVLPPSHGIVEEELLGEQLERNTAPQRDETKERVVALGEVKR